MATHVWITMPIDPAAESIPSPDKLYEALRDVLDPEAGISIVDLGLVYRILVEGDLVRVDLTMTSPACPMGEVLLEDVEAALRAAVPARTRIEVELVWSPPWDPSMMSDAALHLTLLARVEGDLLDRWPLQRWSNLANGVARPLFILTPLASVARGARSKGTKR